MSEQPIMQVHDAGVRYRRGWALRHCSFELRPGAITALVGPNGAGKSTLMLATAGLIGLTEGRISVLGAAVGPRRPTPTSASWPRTNRCTGSSRWRPCWMSAGT